MSWLLKTFLSNLDYFRPGFLNNPEMRVSSERMLTHDFEQVYFEWNKGKAKGRGVERCYRCKKCGHVLAITFDLSKPFRLLPDSKTCQEYRMDDALR